MIMMWVIVLHLLSGDVTLEPRYWTEAECEKMAVASVLMLHEMGKVFAIPTYSCRKVES